LLQQPFPFPVLLKPALRLRENRLTRCKAWVANDMQALTAFYDKAATFVDSDSLMVQELIAGPGEFQFSYAAVCAEGEPVAQLTVRRRRQFPALLGRASTYVEVVDEPDVCSMGAKILREVRFTGIAEVEFKYDAQQQCFKLLDVNPRIWGWHSIGQRAGIDFSYLLWAITVGRKVGSIPVNPSVRWVRLSTDLCVAVTEIFHGKLSVKEYLSSFKTPLQEATFAKDDLLPAIVDLPLTLAMTLRRAVQHQPI
jgi:predicted ATP-grasp superfamily ATP-dependent carboligase